MRTKQLFTLLLAPLLALALAQPADWPHPSELTYEPIEFEPPEPIRAELSNGVVVYLLENRGLPLISGTAYIDARAVYDPDDLVGLASLTASQLREGGAGGRTPEEIDARLEFLAAGVEAGAGASFSTVGFSALADNVDEVIAIWRDVLTRPDFDPQRIEVERQRRFEAIRRVVDDPVQIAVREFFFRLAEGHPSGRYTTEATIGAITRDDLIAFHQSYYAPDAAIIAISGDFDADEMLVTLENALGSWRGEAADPPALPAFNPNPAPRIYYAEKDLQQSIILAGHPSVLAFTDAYNDLTVANDILGAGGFSSRIFTEIRTRRGLAYATGSALSTGLDYPGNFYAFSISRVEATGEVISLLIGEIERLQQSGVTEAELTRSRDTIVNSAIFRDVSASSIVGRAAQIELLGLPDGYYERYLDNVQSVTPAEIQAVAQQELRPNELVIMVVGNEALFDRPLSDFGEVVPISLE
jgi:predicted Zn-dependent peptidase